MRVNRLHTPRLLGHKGSQEQNRQLLKRLADHELKESYWTDHAVERAREMVRAGFDFDQIMEALSAPDMTYWSPTHEQPCGRAGDVSVGVMADRWDRAIVVTVLPSNHGAWNKFYESGGQGRERRW